VTDNDRIADKVIGGCISMIVAALVFALCSKLDIRLFTEKVE